MAQIHGFPPITAPEPRILILGSMPGKASLQANQYYAHPRNSFWTIMAEILTFDPALPYHERVNALCSNQIALWDVLQCCTRESSLDSDIEPTSIITNDLAAFLEIHGQISRICFNGAKAADLYRKHVQSTLTLRQSTLVYSRLPSTSPANARFSPKEKLRAWAAALMAAKDHS